jgi:hypothetical protein
VHRSERRPIVEEPAQVPFAVPLLIERRAQARGFGAVASGAAFVVLGVADRRELGEHGVEEEAEPRALAAARGADAVEAVVPVAAANERKAVRARRDAALDRAHAVLVDRAGLRRQPRREYVSWTSGGSGSDSMAHTRLAEIVVAGRTQMVETRTEPEQIVRALSAGRGRPVRHQ